MPQREELRLRVRRWAGTSWFCLGICVDHDTKNFGEDLIALLGEGEILFGESSFIMRGELQRHGAATTQQTYSMIVTTAVTTTLWGTYMVALLSTPASPKGHFSPASRNGQYSRNEPLSRGWPPPAVVPFRREPLTLSAEAYTFG